MKKTVFNESFKKTSSGCWIWQPGKSSRYGGMTFRGKRRPAHHVSFLMHRGLIQKGKKVLHKCDVPRCVNPDHLFLGTQRDNLIDMSRKGRHAATRKPKEWTEKRFGGKRQQPGEKNGSCKISDRVARAVQKASTGRDYAGLGKRFGLSKSQAWRIATGKSWKHL